MHTFHFKEFSFHVKNSDKCLFKVVGPQGKAIAFRLDIESMQGLEDILTKAITRMYSMEKREYDVQFDDPGFHQMEMKLND